MRTCSGCAAIQTSGKSDSRSTSSDERATNKARTYANGSILLRLAPARMLKQIAAVSPPRSLPTNIQFLRPIAHSRSVRSEMLLSISRTPFSVNRRSSGQ